MWRAAKKLCSQLWTTTCRTRVRVYQGFASGFFLAKPVCQWGLLHSKRKAQPCSRHTLIYSVSGLCFVSLCILACFLFSFNVLQINLPACCWSSGQLASYPHQLYLIHTNKYIQTPINSCWWK